MVGILRTRRCKRCGGNVFLTYDEDGMHTFCIQCGAVYYEAHPQPADRHPVPTPPRFRVQSPSNSR